MKKVKRQKNEDEEVLVLLNMLEMNLERTLYRIKIAELLNMNTFRLRISAKLNRYAIKLCYSILSGMMFAAHFDNSVK